MYASFFILEKYIAIINEGFVQLIHCVANNKAGIRCFALCLVCVCYAFSYCSTSALEFQPRCLFAYEKQK